MGIAGSSPLSSAGMIAENGFENVRCVVCHQTSMTSLTAEAMLEVFDLW